MDKANGKNILPAGTTRFTSKGHPMIWVNTAAEKYSIPMRAASLIRSVGGVNIHRETRWVHAGGGKVKRSFIREAQCGLLVDREKRLAEAWAATAKMRAAGMVPVRQAARTLNRSKHVVIHWCHHGCPYLDNCR